MRLSIIGPEDGAQPILQGDDLLVANGEIYNHADLRAILGEDLFRRAESRWVARLDGMFAFVLATPDRIVAARDPLGIKPLYVARMGGGYAFASELKAFDGIAVDGIDTIPAGCLYDSRDGWRTWSRMPQGAAEPEGNLDEARTAEELRLVLEQAVEKWMVADVEVGAFLSGGLDSSIMAAIAQRQRVRRGMGTRKMFSVGLDGSPELLAAGHIGSDHREYAFTAQDLADNMFNVIYHPESADVDLVRSAIPNLFAARLARRDVKAVLTGEGADELFTGYDYHHTYVDAPAPWPTN